MEINAGIIILVNSSIVAEFLEFQHRELLFRIWSALAQLTEVLLYMFLMNLRNTEEHAQRRRLYSSARN